jgi:hypothetical protein
MLHLARIASGSGLSATVISEEPIQGGTIKVVLRFACIFIYLSI